MNLDELYQTIILDHYREKHHSGLRDPYEAEVHHVNPSCGDELTLRVHLDGGTIADMSYAGEGCSISQASTSVLGDLVIGQDINYFSGLYDDRTLYPEREGCEDGQYGGRWSVRFEFTAERGRHRMKLRWRMHGTEYEHIEKFSVDDGTLGSNGCDTGASGFPDCWPSRRWRSGGPLDDDVRRRLARRRAAQPTRRPGC